MPQPFISICIPAYKRTHFLQRLLTSIGEQTYKSFEVVVTDDSNDNQVAELCKTYKGKYTIHYHKNTVPLGAAGNWNRCLERGNGEWLKIMHDDDWFVSKVALEKFASATTKKIKFIWCNYVAKNENTQKMFTKNKSEGFVLKSITNPFLLFGNNVVGPPSTVMVHRSVPVKYDTAMLWLVDIDYFISVLLYEHAGYYIHEPLVYFSYNDEQLTKVHFNNKETEIHEAMMLWSKHGGDMINNVATYNAWWRMIRNLGIRSLKEFEQYARGLHVPAFIGDIISFQKKAPPQILNNPVLSKALMLLCYRVKYLKKSAAV